MFDYTPPNLTTASIQDVNLGTSDIFSIGVDLSNEIAYKLYSSMGFEVQTKLVTHVWKNKS